MGERRRRIEFGHPWDRICFLETENSDGKKGMGSGAVIGPRAVLTAAHVLYERPTKEKPVTIGEVSKVYVIPGGYESGRNTIPSTEFEFGGDWKKEQYGDRKYDYACVILPVNYSQTRYFGILSREKLNKSSVTLAGFPNPTREMEISLS